MPKTNKRVVDPLRTLRQLRKAADLRQKQLADLVDCSLDTIKSLEQGRLKLSESLALRISIETGISLKWLIDNDLSATMTPSDEGISLWERRNSAQTRNLVYTSQIFDLVRASKGASVPLTRIWAEVLGGLEDHARLRAIIENARKRNLYQLARYKMDKFIKEMDEEFGSDASIYQMDLEEPVHVRPWADKIIEFVQKELDAAKIKSSFWSDPSGYNTSSPLDQRQEEALYDAWTMTEVVSPYEDLSSPEVKERVKTAIETDRQRTEALEATLKKRGGNKRSRP